MSNVFGGENPVKSIERPTRVVTPEQYYKGTVNPQTVETVLDLISVFGEDANLSEVKKGLLGKKIHRCPKCHGKGYTVKEYNAYPSGLPDSGWAYEPGYKNIPCDLCHGEGWLDKEMKPKYKQVLDGYEEV